MTNIRKYIHGTLYNNKPTKPRQYISILAPHVALLLDNGPTNPAYQTVLYPDGTECQNPEVSTPKMHGYVKTLNTLDYDNMVLYSCGGKTNFSASAVGMYHSNLTL